MALIIPLLSGLRLGIFNIDTEQSESFRGLPHSGKCLFCFFTDNCQPLLRQQTYREHGYIQSVLLFFTVCFSILMVTRIPMISLKVKHIRLKGNELRLLFVSLSVLLFLLAGVASLPQIIIIYIVVSITMPSPVSTFPLFSSCS
ncbi:MAG: hypothetical protein R2727_03625 [Bacteroidales bacterium]